jgi:hypothetical protein
MTSTTAVKTIRLGACALFLTAAFFFFGPIQLPGGISFGAVQVQAVPQCDGYCSTGTACEDECLDSFDNLTTCGDYGICAPDCSEVCGSDVDCNTECSGGSGDCADYNGGQSNGECYGACGDGVCQIEYEGCECVDCQNMGSCHQCGELGSCDDYTECPDPEVDQCLDGCCMAVCGPGNDCGGGNSRSCDKTGTSCYTNNDCCDDETCVQVPPYYDLECVRDY